MKSYELTVADDSIFILVCPYCHRVDKRELVPELSGQRCGCVGCGVSSVVPHPPKENSADR